MLGQSTDLQKALSNRRLIDAAGLRIFPGRHIAIITDVPNRAEVEDLINAFDQAVPGWCDYFDVAPKDAGDWKTIACLMVDQEKFMRAKLLPDDLPPFPAGFQRHGDIWFFVQPGNYYTRHLLLHEGTHAFMEKFLGGFGPPWYSEGMAELLAVHKWKDGKLYIKHRVKSRDEVPNWGRVKIIRDCLASDQKMSLAEVLEIPNDSFQKVRFYAWAWAACEFFDSHPEYQDVFRKQMALAAESAERFNKHLKSQISNWDAAENEWQMMIEEIEYGYDVRLAQAVPVIRSEPAGNKTVVTVSADRGWQSTGIQIEANRTYEFTASGQFQIKHDGKPWISQAGGVTIEYYRGRPLGQLIASIKSEDSPSSTTAIGRRRDVKFDQSGELYLRINESPAAWDDNQGSLEVTIHTKD